MLCFFYTMEPSFYADLLSAATSGDEDKIKSLGPFAYVMQQIISNGCQSEAKRDKTIQIGCKSEVDASLGNFKESFLLFRCVFLDQTEQDTWHSQIDKSIVLNLPINAFKNL